MISGDFMTELELLFYITFGLIYGCAVDRKDLKDIAGAWGILLVHTFAWGLFHQILKTIFFRIPWYDLFMGLIGFLVMLVKLVFN